MPMRELLEAAETMSLSGGMSFQERSEAPKKTAGFAIGRKYYALKNRIDGIHDTANETYEKFLEEVDEVANDGELTEKEVEILGKLAAKMFKVDFDIKADFDAVKQSWHVRGK